MNSKNYKMPTCRWVTVPRGLYHHYQYHPLTPRSMTTLKHLSHLHINWLFFCISPPTSTTTTTTTSTYVLLVPTPPPLVSTSSLPCPLPSQSRLTVRHFRYHINFVEFSTTTSTVITTTTVLFSTIKTGQGEG